MGEGDAVAVDVISRVTMRSEGRVGGVVWALDRPLAVAWRAQWRERLKWHLGEGASPKAPSFLSFFGRVCLPQGLRNKGKSKDFGAK